MKDQLIHLYEGGQFSKQEAKEIMLQITNGSVSPEQVAAFLMALNMRSLIVDELSGFREAMVEQALQYDFSEYDTTDIVGTGGDGKNTFNISTCTSFVVAGAGLKVAKHGSYAVSSISGSADVLNELGVQFTSEEGLLRRALEKANICFLHAPLFHPAMKHVVPIRRALQIKTIFNILGPLINPSKPSYSLIGVYSDELVEIFAKVLAQTDVKSFSVIHNLDGYDEVSLTDNVFVMREKGKEILNPSDFGSKKIDASTIFGGSTKQDAAKLFLDILNNESNEQCKEVVFANAAMAITTSQPDISLTDAKEMAKQSLESGAARASLDQLVSISNEK